MIFLLWAEPIAQKVSYFAALGASKVKLFKGPGSAYPLLYILVHRHYPVKVVGEFDHWCRIICPDGETGWIRKCYLSTKYRRSLVMTPCTVHKKPDSATKVLAHLHKNVFVRLKKSKGNWCYVTINNQIKGWVLQKNLWNV